MFVISLLMVISVITAIAILSEADRVKRPPVHAFDISELDYLYSYKSLLLRMVEMEKRMVEFESSITGYVSKSEDVIVEPVFLKRELDQVNNSLKNLIETYAKGEHSLSNISFELDLIDNRLANISYLIAA